jgi:two-component system cell cycle sensor histidine kinase/response regulator CckA
MAWLGAAASSALAILALRPEMGGAAREPVVAVIAAVGLAALAAVIGRAGGRGRAEPRNQTLAAAIEADERARLILDAEGRVALRNARADDLFGPAEDPAAPLIARVGADERAAEEIGRLVTAARQGGTYRTEVWLPRIGGGEWMNLSVHPLPGGGMQWTGEDVSAIRAIEETIRAENELLADFIDFMPVGFYSADTGGRLRFVNQRLAEWLGHPVGELVGKDLVAVLGVAPDPEEESAEVTLVGRGGDSFPAIVTQTVFDEGGETFTRSVVVRENLPEQQWQRDLNTAEQRFRWLFADAPVGIALVDPDTTVSVCNPAFANMLAESAAEVAGRPIGDFIHTDDRNAVAEQLSRVLMGASPGAHLPVRLAGGPTELSATLYVSPTAEDGAASGLMLHFIDTTEQKNLEIRFAQSQKMQAMGQLAGGVAHDFNNLLTAMIGFCDLLLQRHGPGDSAFADIMQIKQNANRAASLVRQLLAFSRRQTLQPRLFDITDALADISNLLRRLMGESIELVVTHGRDLGLVRVDPGQFDQVVINLAVNARDAMPGGGTLTVATSAVTVEKPFQYGAETMPPGNYVQIEVSDTGTGIAAENLPRIFEPFFSTKAVGAGTGLGLSTVYGILRQTDGFIFVDSAPGDGTTFHIFLPRFEPSAAEDHARSLAAGSAAESFEAGGGGDLTGAGTILIVEDEDAVRLFGARALRNKGYRVLEARSGEGALDVLRGEDNVDVLVSDVVMPGMDGATLARLVRMERPAIRVILMSGYAEDVAPGLVGGEDGIHFLPKPFSLKQLAGKVKEVLAEPVAPVG